MAEALSRLIPNADCRVIIVIRHRHGACIDSFGVGTALATSADAPSLSVIYKLVEIDEGGQVRSTAKLSEEKKTYPGRKQVFRFVNKDGIFLSDLIALEDEPTPGAKPLLIPVMRDGRSLEAARQGPIVAVKSGRERFLASRQRLPAHLLSLKDTRRSFPVSYSARLEQLSDQIRRIFLKQVSTSSVQTKAISRTMIFWEVDVQNDFMLPGGKLYVAGAEEIVPNVNRLVEACRRGHILMVSSADAHNIDDSECSRWPSHCVKVVLVRNSSRKHRYLIA